MSKFLFIFITLLFIPAAIKAQSIKVEPSGRYDGPLQTVASPVVVELFSSEHCPACPPADEYIGELAKSDNIIALSCHVNYFGKTKANLGKEFCTDRQTRYIEQIGRKSHFTPQMMINGHMSEIGYDTNEVAASIVKARAEKTANISITPQANGVYNFSLKSQQLRGDTSLWLAVYQKPKAVTRRGKTINYNNVVKDFMPLGEWSGHQISRPVFPVIDSKSSGFAIVAQENKSGKIIAAGHFKL